MKRMYIYILIIVCLFSGTSCSLNGNEDEVEPEKDLKTLYFENYHLCESIFDNLSVSMNFILSTDETAKNELLIYLGNEKVPFKYVVYSYYVFEGEELKQPYLYELESVEKAREICIYYNHYYRDPSLPRMLYKNNIIYFEGRISSIILGEYDKNIVDNNIISLNKETLIAHISKSNIVTIPDVKEIGYNCFELNYYLTHVITNNNLEKIGRDAFYSCFSLSKVELNDKLTYIGSFAFYYNYNLSYIVIPKSVEYIGYNAFSDTIVYCEAESKPEGWDDEFYTLNAKVYYAGEWEYDYHGVPKPIKKI